MTISISPNCESCGYEMMRSSCERSSHSIGCGCQDGFWHCDNVNCPAAFKSVEPHV
jgi:hypothetical protein